MPESNFIDYVKICCRSGAGGAGSAHFMRAKHTPHGGPDGGNGGRGGHIILRGNSQLWTLLHLKYKKHVVAEPGQKGSANNSSGVSGKDVILEVPLGTVAKKAETGELICEITEEGQEFILTAGGRGGLGNKNFTTSVKQAPTYAQPGESGLEEWNILELKLLADVGLVGLPNAGKSTLLSVVSAAKPEIANYPFTTLVPQLGVVKYRDYQSFVMADIPGIIEGASEGRGIGLRFLRHIERNSLLLFMISIEEPKPNATLKMLLNELKQYNPELIHKERLLAITKADLVTETEKKVYLKKLKTDLPTVLISAHTGEGIPALKDLIWQTLNR